MVACYISHQKVTHHPFSSPVNYTDSFAPSPINCPPSCLVSQSLFHLNLLHYKNLSIIYFSQSNWCQYGASKTLRTQYVKTHTYTYQSRTVFFSLHIQSNQILPVLLVSHWFCFTSVISPVTDHFQLFYAI